MKLQSILLLITCLIVSCKNIDSTESKANSEKSPIQEENNLYFSKENFTKKKLAQSKFVNNFILNKDNHLNLHFTLDKPLIKSLQLLAPNLTIDQLLSKGNFQFSILVDNNLIHVENLNKGAGLKESKTKQLEHIVPLISPEPLDHWAWFTWLKFMKLSGGQDELSLGNHKLSIEIRPYIQQDTLKVGALLAKGNINIDVAEIPFDKKLVPVQEIKPNSEWELSKDTFDRSKIEALNKKIAQYRFENINGIVILKEGKLLIEEYFNGEKRESLHDPRSVGKTIASTIMGIAIQENYINNEELFLKDFYDLKSFKNYSPKKDSVTLKSLLTMSSSFLGNDDDYNSPGNEENMYPTDNWVKFALDLPLQKNRTIGEDYAYFTAGVVVLGDIINKSVPNGLVSYADKKLFSPLNITNYKWEYTPQNVGNTAGGIRLTALDFAKYGQLYKNKGQWNGKQILSKTWVEKSLSKQVKQNNQNNGYYGYLFWNKIYTINGKDYEVSFCTGNGGNKIFIFKNIPFVIVINASAYNLPYAHSNVDKMMIDYILPAIITNR